MKKTLLVLVKIEYDEATVERLDANDFMEEVREAADAVSYRFVSPPGSDVIVEKATVTVMEAEGLWPFVVVVTHPGDMYKAEIRGHGGWSTGPTAAEAIGSLAKLHGEALGLRFEHADLYTVTAGDLGVVFSEDGPSAKARARRCFEDYVSLSRGGGTDGNGGKVAGQPVVLIHDETPIEDWKGKEA